MGTSASLRDRLLRFSLVFALGSAFTLPTVMAASDRRPVVLWLVGGFCVGMAFGWLLRNAPVPSRSKSIWILVAAAVGGITLGALIPDGPWGSAVPGLATGAASIIAWAVSIPIEEGDGRSTKQFN